MDLRKSAQIYAYDLIASHDTVTRVLRDLEEPVLWLILQVPLEPSNRIVFKAKFEFSELILYREISLFQCANWIFA